MLTLCPGCHTTFRVTPEQLKARYGRVRCGHCHGVFNALETLIEEPLAQVPAGTAPAPVQEEVSPTSPPPAPEVAVPPPEPAAPQPEPVPAAQPSGPVEPPAEETVDEPEIEYVEIGDLGPIGADEDFADEFTDPGRPTELSIKSPARLVETDEIDTIRDIVFSASLAPIDEPPPDFTKTVVMNFSNIAPPEESEVETRPLMEPLDIRKAVTSHQPPVGAGPTEARKPASVIDFPRQAPAVEEPDEIATLVNEGPADRHDDAQTVIDVRKFVDAARGKEAPANDETAGTIVNIVDRLNREPPDGTEAEEVATLVPSPAAREPHSEAVADATASADTFVETVVMSLGGYRPPPEAPAPPPEPALTVLDFEIAPIEAEPAAATQSVDAAEPVAGGKAGVVAEPSPPPEEPAEDFTKTVVMRFGGAEFAEHLVPADVPAAAPTRNRSAHEILDEPDFDFEPIADGHAEDTDEPPSILSTVDEPHTVFPKFELTPEVEAMPSHVTANAILSQLVTAPGTSAPVVAEGIVAGAVPEPEATKAPPTEHPAREPAVETRAEPAILPPEPEAEVFAEAPPVPELQEIPRRRRWPWIVGSVIVAIVLAVQAIQHYRVEISVMMPNAKPALMAMCEVLDCNIPLPSQIDLIGIESSDLSPGAEGAGNLQLSATLRNRAPYNQTWPHLELTLTDAADKALVRRSLAPSEYLPASRKIEEGFPARSEQPVNLALKVPGVPAAGYRLYVFYP